MRGDGFVNSRLQHPAQAAQFDTTNLFNNLPVPDENHVPDTPGSDRLPGPHMSLETNGVPNVPHVRVPRTADEQKSGDESLEGPKPSVRA